MDHAVYTHRGYKGNLYTIVKDDDGWFWSYGRGNNLVDKEAGFSSPEDALQDLGIGKGKYVANVVLDEGGGGLLGRIWISHKDLFV
ncbi:hypothetical protein AAK684_01860 [Leptogranulimonas caecicola]|uniref:Uncharacterized protein n=1 Tax=Leptogranulimonas caecicola TaxID=2894156 RepID=A0AAU9CJA3_9ACTN|nr:hypothetical protein [Leptogranulimonas caecicola]BDC91091.1 hypothetical protein ATTO_09630 [Leptogranulimonas caecicola]